MTTELTRDEVERWTPEHGHGNPLRAQVLALFDELEAAHEERDALADDLDHARMRFAEAVAGNWWGDAANRFRREGMRAADELWLRKLGLPPQTEILNPDTMAPLLAEHDATVAAKARREALLSAATMLERMGSLHSEAHGMRTAVSELRYLAAAKVGT